MQKNFNFEWTAIFGTDEPTPARPIPAIPFVDDPEPLTAQPRSKALTRLLQRAERDEALRKIFGDDVGNELLTLIQKNQADSPGEPSTSTFQGQSLLTPVPERVADPRKIDCKCPCQMCRSGSGCYNCQGDEDGVKCEFSTLRILDDLIPVDPEQHREEMEQAAKRQRKRIAQNRVARHRKGLEPAFEKFRDGLPYAYRPSVIAAMNRVQDTAAQFCAEHLR